MKHVLVQFMTNDFCLLSSSEARKALKTKKISSIKLSTDTHCILVRIKDLFKIKNNINLFLLDDDGTKLDSFDIQKIMSLENICCE